MAPRPRGPIFCNSGSKLLTKQKHLYPRRKNCAP
uniref:Uncharacterized protein n=1 Tax=Arundo donax TaxID=35708 RepID=A0A0A8YJP2_ARUDO